MTPMDPILVAYDGSVNAQRAAALARSVASVSGAHTILAWAVAPSDLAWELNADNYARVTREGTAMLAAEASKFSTPVSTRLLDGESGSALIAAAEESRAGLVLLGTRGRGRLEALLLGSVTRQLMEGCSRPTLAVHDRSSIGKIVAAVDRGENAPTVVKIAATLAQATGAQLILATAINVDRAVVERPTSFGLPAELWADAVKLYADRCFGPLREHAPGAVERVLYGEPTDELTRLMKLESADLLVAGRRGASGAAPGDWYSVVTGLAASGPHSTLAV